MAKPNLPCLQDIRDNLDGIQRICQDYSIGMPDMIHLMIVHELREISGLLEKIDMNVLCDRHPDKPKGIKEVT